MDDWDNGYLYAILLILWLIVMFWFFTVMGVGNVS